MTSTKLLVVVSRKSLTNSFSTSSASFGRHYKLLIVGSGSGGCATASKFSKKLGAGLVGIIEPKDDHYYQPWFTLVGGGIKKVEDSGKKMSEVIPKKADWLKTTAEAFDPKNCTVTTATGEEIKYDFLVMACGLQLNYNLIKGLPEGFNKDPMLCSNYDYEYVQKTWPAIQKFKGGNAIFTLPNTPVKCAGAPQKIMYLAEEAWQKSGVRDKSTYAAGLHKVVDSRDIKINYQRNLIEVNTDKREAIFQKLDSPGETQTYKKLDSPGETQTYKYDFMHITPPMSTPDPVRKSCLVDVDGRRRRSSNRLGGTCNHVAGLLFRVEAANKLGASACTSLPCTWKVPSKIKGVKPTKIKDLRIIKSRHGQSDSKRPLVSQSKSQYQPIPESKDNLTFFLQYSRSLFQMLVFLKVLSQKM
ncbi:SQOR [Mytilus edulis]|uniref:Sulfide:quinone oxidoreductase, mitochondrial n=1 Tax=Mytilus edulis TaxID=6550 RepID=A0A8S3T585_MYTED|nr:SQOR [Mytilus edulis]